MSRYITNICKMLRVEVLKKAHQRNIPDSYKRFFRLLHKKKYEASLLLLSRINEIYEPIMHLIPSYYIKDFARVLIKKTLNENDLLELFEEAVFEVIHRDDWLMRIHYIGYDSVASFFTNKDFSSLLFRHCSLNIFLNDLKSTLEEVVFILRSEYFRITTEYEFKNYSHYVPCLINFYTALTASEKEDFKNLFLPDLPEIPEKLNKLKLAIRFISK